MARPIEIAGRAIRLSVIAPGCAADKLYERCRIGLAAFLIESGIGDARADTHRLPPSESVAPWAGGGARASHSRSNYPRLRRRSRRVTDLGNSSAIGNNPR